jgi:hypothetical protein
MRWQLWIWADYSARWIVEGEYFFYREARAALEREYETGGIPRNRYRVVDKIGSLHV